MITKDNSTVKFYNENSGLIKEITQKTEKERERDMELQSLCIFCICVRVCCWGQVGISSGKQFGAKKSLSPEKRNKKLKPIGI